jgi:putative transposase
MHWLITAVFTWLPSFVRSRHDLGLEIVALQHQLIVLKRRTKRPRLHRPDRLFWILLRHFWPHWGKSLLIVVGWHRQGFRLYWRFRSRSKTVGRPTTSGDILSIVHTMAHENSTWVRPASMANC